MGVSEQGVWKLALREGPYFFPSLLLSLSRGFEAHFAPFALRFSEHLTSHAGRATRLFDLRAAFGVSAPAPLWHTKTQYVYNTPANHQPIKQAASQPAGQAASQSSNQSVQLGKGVGSMAEDAGGARAHREKVVQRYACTLQRWGGSKGQELCGLQ